ncbi:Rv1535 domain-containing protein [Mycolicibacterium vaccae]|uniref:Rv1535 domain-containing protein n=1 Tax=Mycolicibacterium vaccae TaxID=1810 RepID=UPI003CF7BE60
MWCPIPAADSSAWCATRTVSCWSWSASACGRCPQHRDVRIPQGFGDWSPGCHVEFGSPTPTGRTVDSVVTSSGSTPSSDPLTVVSAALTVPLRELYAVLCRLGVIEIDSDD